MAHGKGEKAGRDQWNAVARARHNRNFNKLAEPALDLLEKYLKQGKNLTHQQAERWAGDYPLSVLDEAIKKISTRFGVNSAPELALKYPTISHRDALENIIRDVGVQIIGFQTIRKADMDFAAQYGLPPTAASGNAPQVAPSGLTGGTSNLGKSSHSTANLITQSGRTTQTTGKKVAAASASDPKSVMRMLKVFTPLGNNRQKVATLRDEARRLKLDKNPLAFCFLLRSMFEISAKLYCDDHKTTGGPLYSKATGEDRKLVDVLRDITAHLTNNSANKVMVKALHGAVTELAKSDGILSVTSMNQLVHNPSFSITAHDISTLFGNIYPLLVAMNR